MNKLQWAIMNHKSTTPVALKMKAAVIQYNQNSRKSKRGK